MRKLGGYTHFDFERDDFMAAQYFVLIDLINQEVEAEKKVGEEAKKKSHRKR